MTVFIFLVVLVTLIVVHELGHFVAAKWSCMKVEEFGVGFPPRLWGRQYGETLYTLNALPFGGFVRIEGEDPLQERTADPRAFSSKPRTLQALVLVAGVAMNWLLAFVIFTSLILAEVPRPLGVGEVAHEPVLMVVGVAEGSPAERAGLIGGDTIISINGQSVVDPQTFTRCRRSSHYPKQALSPKTLKGVPLA
jgi:regulator of sigma E protease